MEILFLNTFNGTLRDPLCEFFKNRNKADILCFQEVYDFGPDMRQLCAELFPEYLSVIAKKYECVNGDKFGQVTLFYPGLSALKNDVIFSDDPEVGLGVVSTLEYNNSPLHICNFHGRAAPGNKLDTPERLRQSQGVLQTMETLSGLKIIGGDFNLDIDSESIQMFRDAGYRDLICDYKIPTTRNRVIWEKYPENPQLYADYVFVSKDIQVRSFSVLQNEISDHLPMILEIE